MVFFLIEVEDSTNCYYTCCVHVMFGIKRYVLRAHSSTEDTLLYVNWFLLANPLPLIKRCLSHWTRIQYNYSNRSYAKRQSVRTRLLCLNRFWIPLLKIKKSIFFLTFYGNTQVTAITLVFFTQICLNMIIYVHLENICKTGN